MRVPRLTSDMLLAVKAVTEFRSFQRAGKELGITASAVYKKVKSAGDLFGRRLFIKTDLGMVLTETGKVLNFEGEHTIEHLLLAEDKTGAFVKLEEGRLVVGHSTYLPPKLLAMIHKLGFDRSMGKRIEHTVGLTKDMVQGVVDGTIHAGFGYLPIHHPGLLVRQLFEEPLVVCMLRSHSLATKAEIRPMDLIDERFIAVARGPLPHLHQEIDDFIQSFGFALNVVADAFAPPEAQTMVEQRMGICIVGASAVTHPALIGKPLINRLLKRRSGIFVREDNRHPTLAAFVEMVLSTMSSRDRPAATGRKENR